MYPFNKVCVWIITVKQGQQVRLNVKSFDIEDYQNCVYDYLEVRQVLSCMQIMLLVIFIARSGVALRLLRRCWGNFAEKLYQA